MVAVQVLHFIKQAFPHQHAAAATFIFSLPLGWHKHLPLCARQFGYGTVQGVPFQISTIAQAVLYIVSNQVQKPSWAVKRTAHSLLRQYQLIHSQQSLF